MSEGVAYRFPERPRSERGEKSQMPDFDTRRPQEPDRPSRLHMFVAASKQQISAVGRWSKRTMIRHRRLGLSVSFLAVLAGTLTAWTVWAVETHSEQVDQKLDWAVETPREQLGQEIKLPPTPEYSLYYEASTLSGGSSAAADCVLPDEGQYDAYACEDVITKVTGPVKLASITEELKADPKSGSEVAGGAYIDVMQVSFSRSEQSNAHSTSYCFETEGLAADALRGHSDDVERPVLAGRTDNCYVIVYEFLSPNP
jgi:hypothetical protein